MKIKWSELTPSERDALVAEKVMGRIKKEHWEHGEHFFDYWVDSNNAPMGDVDDWNPTENIAGAWQVVEKMKKSKHENSFNTIIEDNFYLTQITPEYICKAALKAVGVEIE